MCIISYEKHEKLITYQNVSQEKLEIKRNLKGKNKKGMKTTEKEAALMLQ